MENSPNDGEVRVFLTVHFIFYFLYYQPAAPHPPHPSLAWTTAMKAHEGPSSQRRPTQAHKDGKRPIGDILGAFFLSFSSHSLILSFYRLQTTQCEATGRWMRMTGTGEMGWVRAGAWDMSLRYAQTTRLASFGPWVFFFSFFGWYSN